MPEADLSRLIFALNVNGKKLGQKFRRTKLENDFLFEAIRFPRREREAF